MPVIHGKRHAQHMPTRRYGRRPARRLESRSRYCTRASSALNMSSRPKGHDMDRGTLWWRHVLRGDSGGCSTCSRRTAATWGGRSNIGRACRYSFRRVCDQRGISFDNSRVSTGCHARKVCFEFWGKAELPKRNMNDSANLMQPVDVDFSACRAANKTIFVP